MSCKIIYSQTIVHTHTPRAQPRRSQTRARMPSNLKCSCSIEGGKESKRAQRWTPSAESSSSSTPTAADLLSSTLPTLREVNREFRQQQNAINVVEDVASPRELLPVAASLTENQIKQWSPQALSFLGDSVWELFVRTAYFMPRAHVKAYNANVKRGVIAEAQAECLDTMLREGFLTDEEKCVLKWGRNASGNIPSRFKSKAASGNGGIATYKKSSALECLVGYLYILDPARLRELMEYVGLLSEGGGSVMVTSLTSEEESVRDILRAEVLGEVPYKDGDLL
mmetsp:Transcript_6924/g.11989  ORF Transcript_6924/g.11989 Transcript_6924/m.11989 type:complete len:282 (+) Transcript_6924:292-1137(+)